MRVAAADETKHFKLIGTTGTGKSTAIREMLSAALARGDRAVPGQAPSVLAPSARALGAAVVDDRVPVAVRLCPVFGDDLK
jgi:type II secretory pathway predicted ATPase ExeA